MEFFNSFTPVFIKYNFISENMRPTISKNWIECRLNAKSAPGSYRHIQLNVYPKCYDEMIPHFSIDIDYEDIRCGPFRSRSKANVFGILWDCGEKKSQIFIAFENQTVHQKFSKYFRELFRFFRMYNNCKDENKVLSENVDSSEFNEAEQMTPRTSHANVSPEKIMPVSDESKASGSYEDVVLRPKSEHQHNRRLARSLAVISGLFKTNRESGGANHEENEHTPKSLAPCDDNTEPQKKSKKKSWNIFKSKKKSRVSSPSFKHFAEPLNVERFSLPIGPIDGDAEWYDLNREEMSLFEARVSEQIEKFNNISDYQRVGELESESIYGCEVGRHLTVSSNILWSHNLHLSCQSNINLLGANINKEQIHSDVFIEEGETVALPHTVLAPRSNSSFVSTDSHGYVVMHRNYNSDADDSSDASSGFESGLDGNSPIGPPQWTARPTFAISATSDFFSSEQSNADSPASPLTSKTKQKISKKRRLQIRSRKLLGMLVRETSTIAIKRERDTDIAK